MASDQTGFNFVDASGVTWTITPDGTVDGVTDVEASVASGPGAAVAIDYIFSTTTTDADPGNGKLRLSNATEGSSVTVRADLLDVNGADWTALLDTLDDSTSAVKGFLRLVKTTDPTKWILFTVSALASPAGYRNITVAFVAQSGANPFANNDPVSLTFARTGDAGTNGTNGADGSQSYFGTGVPAGGLGVNGDTYDRITGAVYKKIAGIWVDQAFPTKQLLAAWAGTMPAAIGAGMVWKVPKISGAAATFLLGYAIARVELLPVGSNAQFVLEKSAGGGVFSGAPTIVSTLTLTTAVYEIDDAGVAVSVTTGDLLRLRFAALGGLANACAYSVELQGSQTA